VEVDEVAGHGDQVLGLGVKEAGRADQILDIRLVGVGQGLCVGVAGEKGGRDHVDTNIGALRGEDRGHDQLKGIAMNESAARLGVESDQVLDQIESMGLEFRRRSCRTRHPVHLKSSGDRIMPLASAGAGNTIGEAAPRGAESSARSRSITLENDMDDEHGLSGINVQRLFPLPGVVLFPHAVLPLHIFEPRYKQMTEHALASDRLVTIVNVRRAAEWHDSATPKLEEYGCVGRILQVERLPDGRFNFLLLGLHRVRLVHEVPSGYLYRCAECEIIEDLLIEDDSVKRQKQALVGLFRSYLGRLGGVDPDLDTLLESDLGLGVLADILAHALHLPSELKQTLLAERQVEIRVDTLESWLREACSRLDASSPSSLFQPPFSPN
jgi:Lon protease-like protein